MCAEHSLDLAPADVKVGVMIHRLGFVRHQHHKLDARQVVGEAIVAGDGGVADEAPAIQRGQGLGDLFR